jgi:drug/metabolite transporter (DMT)-like permease
MADAHVFGLAVVPAVLWGFSPVLSKRGMAAGGSSLQASLTLVVVSSSLYLTALVVAQGLDAFSSVTPTAATVFLAAGLVGTALGRLATFTGVHRVGASINSAGISSRPLFATALAAAFLGQAVEPVVVGILVLVAGLVLLALSKGGDLAGWSPRDLVFPLAAAFFFGAGNVARAYGLAAFDDVTLLEAVALNEVGALVALAAYGGYAARGDVFSAPPRTYAYFAGSGALTAVALLSLFAALEVGRVAIVDPLAATAPLFTTVFAAMLLEDLERVTRGVVAGATLVVVGAAIVVLGSGASAA